MNGHISEADLFPKPQTKPEFAGRFWVCLGVSDKSLGGNYSCRLLVGKKERDHHSSPYVTHRIQSFPLSLP